MAEELEIARQDLKTSQKGNEDLARHLEEALKAVEDEREKAIVALIKARNNNCQLQWSNDDLNLDLHRLREADG